MKRKSPDAGGRLRLLALTCAGVCMAAADEPAVRLDLGGGVSIDLMRIHAGRFTQGSPADEAGRGADEDSRPVAITRDFLIGKTPVTRGQWERFVTETGFRSEAETGTSGGYGWDGSALVQKKSFNWRNPGFPQTSDHPVCLLTFPDAQAFCTWLSRKTGRRITLPTEAQWEYACRAGTLTAWHSGGAADDCDRIAWHKANAGNGTRPVNEKAANPWGLYIGGNVSEWCLDWYAPYPSGPAADPIQENPNLSDKPRHVLRGGSWFRDAKHTRSAARYRADPRSRNADTGFRIVSSVDASVPAPVAAPVLPVPKVEADPGDSQRQPQRVETPVRVQDVSPPSNPARTGSSIAPLFSSLLCLLIPIGLMILFVRIIAGHANRSSNPFVGSTPPPVPRQLIRKVDDGFWIDGNWPVGTALVLRYVVNGMAETQNLVYRPGPEGQFVFTGVTPDSVSVVAGEDEHDVLPPIVAGPTIFERDDDPPAVSSAPPIFPSAY